MATISTPTSDVNEMRTNPLFERWFFTCIALAMIATAVASFAPSITHPAERQAPLSILAAAHGVLFFAWLLLFLVQSLLIATQHRAIHKKLGLAAFALIALMVPLGFTTTTAMIRRGFDLSGDLHAVAHTNNDPEYSAVFAFFNLLIFAALAVAAIAYRRRPEIHKRLMLFANIELMPAPLAHLIGHTPRLAALPPAIVMIPISIFLIAAFARDWIQAKRVHPLTWSLAFLRICSGPIEAGPIGSSVAWHHFAQWLAR